MTIKFERDIHQPAWRARPKQAKCYYYAGRIGFEQDGPLDSELWYAYRVYGNDEDPDNWKPIGNGYSRLWLAKLACEWDFLKRYAKTIKKNR
jgi:hypothetical protein